MTIKRRDFLTGAGGAFAASAALGARAAPDALTAGDPESPASGKCGNAHAFNASYAGEYLEHIAFPMGGFGAGMICLEGTGALSNISLHHQPDLANEPGVFAAISINGVQQMARVLEGQVPRRKWRPTFDRKQFTRKVRAYWGLPRFRDASFAARFPFAEVTLSDDALPLVVKLTGWNPFEPNDPDNASLPVAGLEYEFANTGHDPLDMVFSFNATNFMTETRKQGNITAMPGGFQLHGAGSPQKPWDEGTFAVWVDDPAVRVNTVWSDIGGVAAAWAEIQRGACYSKSALAEESNSYGGSLFVPFKLASGERRTISVRMAWFVRGSNLRRNGGGRNIDWLTDSNPSPPGNETYSPWYTSKFDDIAAVIAYWNGHYQSLRDNTARFTNALYDCTLPPEVVEAVTCNLTILKSPTVLRQADGRLWGWEGCYEDLGSCEGTCTHVWNYAQAIPHLFPSLERTLRDTEFGPSQREDGHQDFRAALPIRPTPHTFLAAADGQLGGIMKVYRDWRISGDSAWLRILWPKVRASLDYCIRTWDPKHVGWLEEPHHTTFDTELWGPDGMCTGIYLGALQAAVRMGRYLHDDVALYAALLKNGARRTEAELFNGEYFIQKIRWLDLESRFPQDNKGIFQTFSADDLRVSSKEGPPFQYGSGCLATGTVGPWLALVCGVGQVLDPDKVSSYLQAIHRYNLKHDLTQYSNPTVLMRAFFALGNDAGLVMCTWPKEGELTLPLLSAPEVWSGIEYQVASHLMLMGMPEKGLDIVRACRKRYDGGTRNPFDEVEAGHWYARAMSSYALLQALSGARYDAVDRVLYLTPAIKGDFRSFLSTASGYGVVGVRNGQPFVEVRSGKIPYKKIEYQAAQ